MGNKKHEKGFQGKGLGKLKMIKIKEGHMSRFVRVFVIVAGLGIFLITAPAASFAQKDSSPKKSGKTPGIAKTDVNEHTGTVVSVSRRYITIEISQTGTNITEIVIPYDDQTVLTGTKRDKKITDLQPGDVVKINYKETYVEEADLKRNEFKRTATQISLTSGAR